MGYRRTILLEKPVAYYRLGEAVGAVAADEMRREPGTYVNTPTLSVAGLITGDSNDAVDFNGTTNHMTIPGGLIESAGSIELWFQPGWSSGDSTARKLFGGNDGGSDYLRGEYTASDEWKFGWNVASTDHQVTITEANMPVTAGSTYHLVITWDDTANETRVYLNGVETGNQTSTLVTDTITSNFYFATSDQLSNYFDGTLDEIAVFGTVLTPTQVRRHYGSGLNKNGYNLEVHAAGPVSHWKLGEAIGTTAADDMGVYDGTYVGSPTLGSSSLVASDLGNTAITLDGTDDYVDINGIGAAFADGDDFTLEMWFNTTAAPATDNEHMLFSAHTVSGVNILRIGTGDSGGIFISVGGDAGTEQGSGFNDGANHILHVVVDGSGNTNVYVDAQELTGFSDLAISWTSATQVSIGQEYDGAVPGDYFIGDIDEVAIYKSVLDVSTVRKHVSIGAHTEEYVVEVVDSGASAYYRMGEIAGTTALDVISDQDGTYVNSPTLGVTGLIVDSTTSAVDFDGTNDHLTVPGSLITSTGSIELWFKPDWSSGDSTLHRLMGGNGGGSDIFRGNHKADNVWDFGWRVSSTDYRVLVNAVDMSVTSGEIYHLVFTWDDAANESRVYLDGVETGNNTSALVTAAITTDFFFGTMPSITNFFDGTMDEIAIYGKALSADEVARHFAIGSQNNAYVQAIVADIPAIYYRLGESSGTVAADVQGNFDGTIAGTPTLEAAGAILDDADTAITFDGTDDAVYSVQDAALPKANESLSSEVWAKWTSVSTVLVAQSVRSGALTADEALLITLNHPGGAGQVTARHNGNEANSPLLTYNDGIWHHIVATWDSATSDLLLYVDGIEIASNLSATGGSTSNTWFKVGANGSTPAGTTNLFIGDVDEAAVYAGVLTPAQILDHYIAGILGSDALVGTSATINEVMNADDTGLGVQIAAPILTETTALTTAAVVGIGRGVVEQFTIDDGLGLLDTIFENMTLIETAEVLMQVARVIAEQLTANDTVVETAVTRIVEALSLSESIPTNAKLNRDVIEDLTAADIIGVAFSVLASEDWTLAEAEASLVEKAARVVEALLISGAVEDFHRAVGIVAEAVTLTALAARFFDATALDSVGVGEALLAVQRASEKLLEDTLFQDTGTESLRVMAILEEQAEVSDTLTAAARLAQAIEDGFRFVGSLQLNDVDYSAWVVNTESLGITEYGNYPFNSFTRMGQEYYGATELGIYSLSGGSDDGQQIDAVIRTGLMDFGSSAKKRVPGAYLAYTADGRLVMKISVTETGEKKEYWYELNESQNAPVMERIKVGKGLKARYWQFELTNTGGINFELDELKLYRVVLSRRI